MLLPQIFKANDIRGVVGSQWDSAGAYALGAAFQATLKLAGKSFILGHDNRLSGPELVTAFAEGSMRGGANVIDIGLASTDEVWFTSGYLGLPGVQFTASHNSAEYNGVKFCLRDAAPITPELMAKIQELSFQDLPAAEVPGKLTQRDVLPEYANYLRRLVDLSGVLGMKIVVDAGNGMAGLTVPAVFGSLGIDIVGLFFDLDGSFPNHPPNPLEPANLVAAQQAVVANQADLGLVFDGDADRCFVIDEQGEVVSPSIIAALVAQNILAHELGAAIVVNTITSRVVADTVAAAGGQLIVSTVGHTAIKAHMVKENAVFGGEHSAHFYFREFWGADSGLLAALTVIALVAQTGKPISQLSAGLSSYVNSGELNTSVTDPKVVMAEVAAAFPEGEVAYPDGLFITGDGWWVSVRESNTEPLLRLNVEADDQNTMAALRDRALAIIRKENR